MVKPESTERLLVCSGPDAETSLVKFDFNLSLVARLNFVIRPSAVVPMEIWTSPIFIGHWLLRSP